MCLQVTPRSRPDIAHVGRRLTLLLQFPRSGNRSLGRLMIEDCRRHCIASNRKSDSFSPLGGALLLSGSKRAFSSCTGLTGLTGLAAGFLDRGLVDLSTLGRPVDPLEGIIRCGDEIAGRDGNWRTHLILTGRPRYRRPARQLCNLCSSF